MNGDVEALAEHWRVFREHRPTGAYLPLGQLDGDCRECGEPWPCSTVEPLLAARVQAARAEERERLVNPDDETLTRMADAAWATSGEASWVSHDMMLAALAALRTPDAAPEEES